MDNYVDCLLEYFLKTYICFYVLLVFYSHLKKYFDNIYNEPELLLHRNLPGF